MPPSNPSSSSASQAVAHQLQRLQQISAAQQTHRKTLKRSLLLREDDNGYIAGNSENRTARHTIHANTKHKSH